MFELGTGVITQHAAPLSFVCVCFQGARGFAGAGVDLKAKVDGPSLQA